MSIARKIAFNTIFQIIGKLIYFGISIVIIVLITRNFGVSGYGTYNIILVYLSLFGVVSDFGLQVLLAREIANNKNYRKRFRSILGLRVVSALIFFLLSFVVLFVLPYDIVAKKGILIYSIGMFFYMLNNLIYAFFQNKINVYKNTISDILGRIVVLLGMVVLIKLNLDILWVIWVSVFGIVANFIINYMFILKEFVLYPTVDLKHWKIVLKDAIPLAIVYVLYTLFFQIDSFLLSILPIKHAVFSFLKNISNTDAVGIYGVAYRIITVAMTFPAVFLTLVFPFFSRSANAKNKNKLNKYFQYSIDFSLVLAIPMMVLCIVFAHEIVFLIAGKEFMASVLPFRIWFLSLPFIFLFSASGYVFMAHNQQKKFIIPYLIYLVFNVCLNLLLIPYYSYLGAAITTFITEIFVVLGNFYLIKRFYKLTINYVQMFRFLISGAVSGLAIYYLSLFFKFKFELFDTIILVVIGLVVAYLIFLLVLYLLKGIDKNIIKKIFVKA